MQGFITDAFQTVSKIPCNTPYEMVGTQGKNTGAFHTILKNTVRLSLWNGGNAR